MMFILCAAVLAQDNEEARVKAAVEDRYRESIAAANKKDTAAMTNLYDDNAVLMPQSEEAVLGKPRSASITRSFLLTLTSCRSR
jgi:ketosteroid isomerase-like protein